MQSIRISRGQLLFLCALFVLVMTFYAFSFIPRRINTTGMTGPNDVMKYEILGKQSYIRDYRGYLYPKGYFDDPPTDENRRLKDIDWKGQHSDTVLPECDEPDGVDPALTNENVGWIDPPTYLPNYKNPCWYDNDKKNATRLRCIPYFYLIGVAKSGSTDLFYRINQHLHVEATKIKEHRWFDGIRFSDVKRKSQFTFYLNRYLLTAQEIEKSTTKSGYHPKICGDGSPSYSWDNIEWYQLPENQHCLEPRTLILSYIHHLTPNAKLIMILRNPVDRLYSHYLFHTARNGGKKDPHEFHEWAETTLKTYQDCYKVNPFRFCMYSKQIKTNVKVSSFTNSIYSRLILDILKIFPRKQLFILEMVDYSKNTKKRLKQIYQFLELDPLPEDTLKEIAKIKKKNPGRSYNTAGPMLNKTRAMLTQFFQPFNEELADMMGDDKYLWLDK